MLTVTKYLNKAIRDKKIVDFKHIKVLLTGSSAAGKSSFCRLLFCSEKFSPKYKSTDVLENKQAFSMAKSSSEEKNGKKEEDSGKEKSKDKKVITVKSFGILKHEKEVVWYELNPETQIKYFKSLLLKKAQDDHGGRDDNDNCEDKKTVDDDQHDPDGDDDDDDASFSKAPQVSIKKEVVDAEPLPDCFTIETVKLVTVVDTGGQPEYIHLLPAINSYPTVTFIVHDLTKKLDDPVLVRYKKERCEEDPVQILNLSYLDMIHLLTSFVSDSLEQQPPELTEPYISLPKKPYIGFVGTHYDEVKDDQDILKNIDEKLDHVVREKGFHSGGILSSEKGIIHPIDNTTAGYRETEGNEVKYIRNQIECFTDQIKSKILPITWMILQLRIQQLCTIDHKKYITYEEYVEVAKECLDDEEEIKVSLLYFHFIGLLLYFDDPSLCGYVIINLQWLYGNLAKVMHLSSKDVHLIDFTQRKLFNNQRLLAKHDCTFQVKDVNAQELEYCFNLLTYLNVIATVTIQGTEFYYLPCVLSTLRLCDDRHKHLLSEPLLIRFKSGFLPRGFFCSLVVHLLNNPPEEWEHQMDKSAKNYSDLMIFRLPDKTYLYMLDKIFYLKVEVRHGRKDFNAPYHSKVFVVFHKYLTMVCNQLHFDLQNLQYGFLCLAEESDVDHIAVLSKEIHNGLECSRECRNITKLDKSHSIWFKEVSSYVGIFI